MKLFQLYPKALAHFACKSPKTTPFPAPSAGPPAPNPKGSDPKP